MPTTRRPWSPGSQAKRNRHLWKAGLIALKLATVVVVLNSAAICGLVLWSLVFWRGPYNGRGPLEFTTQAWADAERSVFGDRYLMLDDLLEKEPLVGRTRFQVEALLGPLIPPTEYPSGGWCYYLGPEPGIISVDNIWLRVEFDAPDIVVAIDTWTD